MAVLRGEQGAVFFETGSGTLAQVIGTRSWTLNVTKETLDVTDHGDSFRKFVGSLISGSGTVELVYDKTLQNQPELIEDVFKQNDSVDANFELFTTGTSTGTDSVSFAGIITSMDIASTVGDLVVATCNFVTSGAITSNLE